MRIGIPLAFLLLAACGGGGGSSPQPASHAALSDEFDSPATLAEWSRVWEVEEWGFDQLELFGIGATRAGWLTMMPYSSSWYEDYRGVLAFKEVRGDFVVTARLEVSNRAGTGAPGQLYSLAGIMVRAPRAITRDTWTPGGENYVFLSLGAASNPGTFQTEVKTTVSGTSTLEIANAASGAATLRVARIGEFVITLIRPEGEAWRVHRRFRRADLPGEMQVGLTTYTDWASVEVLTPEEHNTALITGGNPDLLALIDYVRYAVPEVPAALRGRDLADPGAVPDAELLTFLG